MCYGIFGCKDLTLETKEVLLKNVERIILNI